MKLSALARGFFSLRHTRPPVRGNWRQRALRAFTLIEILVSLVITLIMMGAVVTLFGVVTDSVSGSRALLETADRLRAARNRISLDLQGATVTPIPPRRPENDEGYLEIVEGVQKDSDFGGLPVADVSFASLFGDCDDALLLTTRSRGEPFIGKFNTTGTIESQVAEVAYFLRPAGPPIGFNAATGNPVQLFTLYRRCMLVVPSNTASLGNLTNSDFYLAFDVSARAEGTTLVPVANSLGDLTKPENRFGRSTTELPPIPHVPPAALGTPPTFPAKFDVNQPAFSGNRLGDDVILTNVLSFDVQVFEPGAPVFIDPPPPTTATQVALEPRDAGYLNKLTAWGGSFPPSGPSSPVSFGAYVDLGIAPTYNPPVGPPGNFPRAPFFGRPNDKSFGGPAGSPTRPFSYDTWSLHYETNGVNEDSALPGALGTDTGLNGLDDDTNMANPGFGIVDDPSEMDTLPPYSAPLRGLRISIRVYEPGSQQIRQVTVVQDFLQP